MNGVGCWCAKRQHQMGLSLISYSSLITQRCLSGLLTHTPKRPRKGNPGIWRDKSVCSVIDEGQAKWNIWYSSYNHIWCGVCMKAAYIQRVHQCPPGGGGQLWVKWVLRLTEASSLQHVPRTFHSRYCREMPLNVIFVSNIYLLVEGEFSCNICIVILSAVKVVDK